LTERVKKEPDTMPDSTPSAAHEKLPLLLWGYLFLFSGFLWLVASRFAPGPLTNARAAGFASDAFGKQGSYEPRHVMELIQTFGRMIANSPPWMLTPGLFMLVGGLLLARTG
jgi:hypothetical protein